MPSVDFVPPIHDNMMLEYHPTRVDHNQNYQQSTSTSHYNIPSPEYPDSYNNNSSRHSPLQPTHIDAAEQSPTADMYRHPSPVGSYHSMNSPFNSYASVSATQHHQPHQTQFSPEYITQFQHPPSSVSTAAAGSSLSCVVDSAAATATHHQSHSPVSTWPVGSPPSGITGYPTSPATGGSDWGGYQSSDAYSTNTTTNTAAFFNSASASACAMGTGSIPTFDDFTTGYPTVPSQMFSSQGLGQQGGFGLERQMRLSSAYEWAKAANTYRVNPHTGKTRTKDKYRVVYTDHQRLELEKEFHYSRYITIRRKSELAVSLGLSERQVKIWFQNRRAKERKQNKKRLQGQSESDQPDTSDVEQDEKHDVTTASSTTTSAKQQQQQQHRHISTDGDDIIRSACAQAIKTETGDSHRSIMTSPVKNIELINALRHGHVHPSTTLTL